MIDSTKTAASLASLQDPRDLQRSESTREAAEKFESYLYTFLAKNLRSSIPDGPFSSGPMQTFADLFDQAIGEKVAKGHAFGLADQLERAMELHGMPPSMAPTRAPLHDDGHRPNLGVAGVLTSGFGPRKDPINGEARFHKGVDIGAPIGTPIHAVRGGTVVFAGPDGGHGNMIVVDHGNGIKTRYAHCSAIGVAVGQEVAPNEVIGAVGSTGHSTGPHLHFEVWENGEAQDPRTFQWPDGQ